MRAAKLKNQLQEIERYFNLLDAKKPEISDSTVGWQVDHMTMVLEEVLKALKESNPNDYHYEFNVRRIVIFTLGKIPRGKAKAPKAVRPQEVAEVEVLEKRILAIQKLLDEVDALPLKANFDHPFFGCLNKVKTLKFLEIHTEHHLKIIRDILK